MSTHELARGAGGWSRLVNIETLCAKGAFDERKAGADIVVIASEARVSVPEILKPATITLADKVPTKTTGPSVRVYLGTGHRHQPDMTEVRRRCLRGCIWWGVCYNVCWVCEEAGEVGRGEAAGCYLDIRRVN